MLIGLAGKIPVFEQTSWMVEAPEAFGSDVDDSSKSCFTGVKESYQDAAGYTLDTGIWSAHREVPQLLHI